MCDLNHIMKNILKTLTNEEKEYIKMVAVKKGESLFLEDDLCTQIGIVIKGEIRIISYLKDGKEIVYNVLDEGGVFGNNLIFSSNPFFRGDVIAYKDSAVYLINKETLIELLQTNEEFLIAYLNLQSDFGKSLNLKIKLLTFNNAEDRFMYYMQINKNQIRYKTISDLAKTLFLSREVLSRLIHKLEKNGQIKISDKTIKIQN